MTFRDRQAVEALERIEVPRLLADRSLDDDGNAYRLVDLHGEDLRYLPGAGWYCWDGTRWAYDESGEVIRRARDLVRVLHAEAHQAVAELGSGDTIAKALRRHAKASASRRGVEATL